MKLLEDLKHCSLFARTALTIAITSLLFITFTFALLTIFILLPTAERAVSELTNNIYLAADMWHQSTPEKRPELIKHLEEKYHIGIAEQDTELANPIHNSIFIYLVARELQQHTGAPITIYESINDNSPVEIWSGGMHTYWVPVQFNHEKVMISFQYGHTGMEPSLTIIVILLAGLVATLFTSLILARRLTKPLQKLSHAAQQIGHGNHVSRLPEQGPHELAKLVHSFNTMAQEVQDLIANRTTLLTGISHDLRSPLTRMELALEMLEDSADPTLIKPLHRDIEQMNKLIGIFLEISQEMHDEEQRQIDIVPIIRELVEDHQRSGAEIKLEIEATPLLSIHPLALQRIINNLLENAARYGNGKPIHVVCNTQTIDSKSVVTIDIMDRGQGIPASERESVFRPFHRLDKSRNSYTEGTGLGLSIARQLAQANGCGIELLPREGGGTVARLTIG